MRKVLTSVGPLLAAAVMLSATTIGLANEDATDMPSPVTAREAARELGPVMEVFAKPQSRKERAEGDAAAAQEAEAAVPGENLELRQESRPDQSSGSVAVWPADGQACFAVDGGGGCVPIDVIEAEGVVAYASMGLQVGPGRVRLAGGGARRDRFDPRGRPGPGGQGNHRHRGRGC